MEDNVAAGVMNGLKQSKTVLVFITKRCLDRWNDPNTNCSEDFNLTVKKGMAKVIVVPLEAVSTGMSKNCRSQAAAVVTENNQISCQIKSKKRS